MELKDFIKQTLIQIKTAVHDAEKEGVKVNKSHSRKIHFEVLLTTTSGEEGSASAGIFVSVFKVNADTKESLNSSSMNKISFDIDLYIV